MKKTKEFRMARCEKGLKQHPCQIEFLCTGGGGSKDSVGQEDIPIADAREVLEFAAYYA